MPYRNMVSIKIVSIFINAGCSARQNLTIVLLHFKNICKAGDKNLLPQGYHK